MLIKNALKNDHFILIDRNTVLHSFARENKNKRNVIILRKTEKGGLASRRKKRIVKAKTNTPCTMHEGVISLFRNIHQI